MERLTERDEDGAVTLKCDIYAGINKMVLRLADYEDTGMTPEEIPALKAELYAAVRDLKEMGYRYGFTCEVCANRRGTKDNPCYYPANVDVDDKMCRTCDRCPCGHCDGVSQWEWRGPKKLEQSLAPVDQNAGEYADGSVLAPA